MSIEVNVHDAKTHFSKLLHRVMAGEEVVIAKAGVPVARLVPIASKPQKRVPGLAKGKLWIADDFADELPEDVLRGFEAQ